MVLLMNVIVNMQTACRIYWVLFLVTNLCLWRIELGRLRLNSCFSDLLEMQNLADEKVENLLFNLRNDSSVPLLIIYTSSGSYEKFNRYFFCERPFIFKWFFNWLKIGFSKFCVLCYRIVEILLLIVLEKIIL